jgi:hypothetical protein
MQNKTIIYRVIDVLIVNRFPIYEQYFFSSLIDGNFAVVFEFDLIILNNLPRCSSRPIEFE